MIDFKINPTSSLDWQLIVNLRKQAKKENNKIVPIKSFDLGKTFKANFVAVQVKAFNGKASWVKAGYLKQQYVSSLKVSEPSLFLELNTPNLIKLNNNNLADYRLIFYPPYYFSGLEIKLWQYKGQETSNLDNTLNLIQSSVERNNTNNNTDLLEIISQLDNLTTNLDDSRVNARKFRPQKG